MFRGILKFTFLLNAFLIATISMAQKWELGGLLGASNYNGDLAREIVLKETHVAGGVFFRYNLGKFFSIKPAFQMGTISGNDKNFSENKYRNLSFKSRISEFSTMMEYNFKPFGTQVRTESFTPYLALGIGLFHFNPKAKYFNEWHSLHNLRTEGQTSSSNYKLTQLSVPFGMGLKWSINRNLTLGFEFIYRKTFTDYLDDVSKTYPNLTEQAKTHGALSAALSDRSSEVSGVPEPLSTPGDMRGDPGLKDWYVFSMFSFSYRFTPIICWPNKPSTVWDY
jgi:opacity protein-like surface antigen